MGKQAALGRPAEIESGGHLIHRSRIERCRGA
jgi:hypothetical protein